ncbi:MAG TPA: type III polyketide synthase, partial [Arenibacter sp.]|nr:type III polyketide synthase [Arenibacter sp.]
MEGTRIVAVTKSLPQYSRNTKDILPFVKKWLYGQDDRLQRKVLKIFEGAAVDKRYSIMSPEEVFEATSFEDKN